MNEPCCCGECKFFSRITHKCRQMHIVTEFCDVGFMNRDCKPELSLWERIRTRLIWLLWPKYTFICDTCKAELKFLAKEAHESECPECNNGHLQLKEIVEGK